MKYDEMYIQQLSNEDPFDESELVLFPLLFLINVLLRVIISFYNNNFLYLFFLNIFVNNIKILFSLNFLNNDGNMYPPSSNFPFDQSFFKIDGNDEYNYLDIMNLEEEKDYSSSYNDNRITNNNIINVDNVNNIQQNPSSSLQNIETIFNENNNLVFYAPFSSNNTSIITNNQNIQKEDDNSFQISQQPFPSKNQ
jgi:hypothetical protein